MRYIINFLIMFQNMSYKGYIYMPRPAYRNIIEM